MNVLIVLAVFVVAAPPSLAALAYVAAQMSFWSEYRRCRRRWPSADRASVWRHVQSVRGSAASRTFYDL